MGLKLTIFILNQFISNNNGKFDKYHWDFRAEKVRMSRLQVLWLSGEKWTALQVSECMGTVRDKEKIPPKRSLLCSTTAFSKEVAQQNAAKQDLEVLRTKYNIREDRSMPN